MRRKWERPETEEGGKNKGQEEGGRDRGQVVERRAGVGTGRR